MSDSPISAPQGAFSSTADGDDLGDLVRRLRSVVRPRLPVDEVATRVAGELRALPPAPRLLSAEQRLGAPDRYTQHVLHVEDGGGFSIAALVWRPGQATPIHDHVSWCVVAIVEGTEYETIYAVRGHGDAAHLEAVDSHQNTAGAVCSFTPPGDIHSVRNAGDGTAISLHVYGADISVLGTSIRRTYDLPVRKGSS